ncbi:thiamine phosphate synthase [Consotaella aegiceratis]|uniref:thiamine phosphate synthase n=1 Tax=Consotaella aegiceratis TaxID=3097961 RepID=UPI002F429676
MSDQAVRPRLVLATTPLPDGPAGEEALRAALSGGDVASVLIDPAGRDAASYQLFAERLLPLAQAAGAAAIVVDDTRCAGRLQADGLHLTSGDVDELADAMKRFAPKLIVGASGFSTRHDALEAGERMPDYLMFGRLGGDTHREPYKKNLELAAWWAELVEIPAIVLGGNALETLDMAIATGVEFIALATAVFADGIDPAEAVAKANAVLDRLADGAA